MNTSEEQTQTEQEEPQTGQEEISADTAETSTEEPATEPANEAVPLSEIEEWAAAQGWEKEGRLSAKDYMKNGKWLDSRHDMRGEIRDLKRVQTDTYNQVAQFINKQQERDSGQNVAAYDRAIRTATAEGDTERAVDLAGKKAQIAKPQPVPLMEQEPEVTPDQETVTTWIAKQSYWQTNDVMQNAALKLYEQEVYNAGGTDNPTAIFPKVEARMKEEFPQYFGKQNRDMGTAASDAGKATKGVTGGGLKRGDLTESEGHHFDQFKKMGMKEDKLLQSIADARRE